MPKDSDAALTWSLLESDDSEFAGVRPIQHPWGTFCEHTISFPMKEYFPILGTRPLILLQGWSEHTDKWQPGVKTRETGWQQQKKPQFTAKGTQDKQVKSQRDQ